MANKNEILSMVLESLHRIAPEADLEHARRDADVRDELDIDSMDFLSFVTELHRKLGVEIAERDYGKLVSIDGAVEYLERAVNA